MRSSNRRPPRHRCARTQRKHERLGPPCPGGTALSPMGRRYGSLEVLEYDRMALMLGADQGL